MKTPREILKEQLAIRNISYGELSKLTGIPKSTLQRYVTGTTIKIPMEAVNKIEQALNLNPGTIMGWENTPQWVTSPQTELDRNKQKILEAARGLSRENLEKLIEYIKFLKSQQNQ